MVLDLYVKCMYYIKYFLFDFNFLKIKYYRVVIFIKIESYKW